MAVVNRMSVMRIFCCCSLLASVMLGCSLGFGSGEVTGVVLVDGTPSPGLEVRFTSVKNPENVAMGVSGEGGIFKLSKARGVTTVPGGKYKVTVEPIPLDEASPKPTVVLSDEFTDVNLATLIVTVVAGKNDMKIEVTSKGTSK